MQSNHANFNLLKGASLGDEQVIMFNEKEISQKLEYLQKQVS